MRMLLKAFLVLLLSSSAAVAAPASEDSIRRLLEATQVRKLLDDIRAQTYALMNDIADQAMRGRPPNARQQAAIARMKEKMIDVMQAELAWEKMEPLYLRLYQETFSEEEVASMLAFYSTPAGKALVLKMPALVQKTMHEVQTMVSSMAPKMQQIEREFVDELKAASR
jgi:hypothetical protein